MTIEEMKARKIELGYSCEELARISGVPYATIQKLFAGLTKAPRRKTVLALERVLKKSFDYRDYRDSPNMPGSEYLCVRDSAADHAGRELFNKSGVGQKDGDDPGRKNTADAEEKSVRADSEIVAGAGEGSETDKEGSQNTVSKKTGPFTIDDYYDLPEETRVELIDGYFYDMASPGAVHQQIQVSVSAQLYNYIKKKKGSCKVFTAPFDVRLNRDDKTMVQPDVLVICKKENFTEKRGEGAPDMVVEILSPSTAKKDTTLKLRKYMAAGVREYWVIDPKNKRIIVYYTDDEGVMLPSIYGFDCEVQVNIWGGKCKVDFREFAV